MAGFCDSPYAAPDCEAQLAKRRKKKKAAPKVARPPQSRRGLSGTIDAVKARKKRLKDL